MSIQRINIGNLVNDGLGDDLRTAFEKINGNFDEITSLLVDAAGNILTIGAETSARIAADLELQARIDSEISARIAADILLQSSINNVSGGLDLDTVSNNTVYYIGLSAASNGKWVDARVDPQYIYYTTNNRALHATNFNTASDLNLKTNVDTITNPIDIINKLRGVSFNWKETELKSYGVIAQEIENVLPELVSEVNGKKTVNYTALIGILIEAVKELSVKQQAV